MYRQPDLIQSKNLFKMILEEYHLDLNDPNLKDTPRRLAEMFCEVFSSVGKDPMEEPKLRTTFPNDEGYNQMILFYDIPFSSFCSHHFVPFSGSAWIVYIPSTELIGLSKPSRIIEFFGKMPQLQERLTHQVAKFLDIVLKPRGLLVLMKAVHECTRCRGVNHKASSGMMSSCISGVMEQPEVRAEAFSLIQLSKG